MPEGDDDTSVITSSEGEGRKAPRVQEISVRPLNFAVNLRLPLKRTLFYKAMVYEAVVFGTHGSCCRHGVDH